MILAAGRGERMRPLTDRIPKPLLEVHGKSLIVRVIEALVGAGLRDIVINHAHLGGQIVAALGDGSAWSAHIRYSPERQALETAGGIAQALPQLGDEPFVVANADILCDYDFAALARRPLGDDLAHLVLVDNPEHHPQGDFALAAGRVSERAGTGTLLTFSGIGLYSPKLFEGIAAGMKAPLAPLLRKAMAAGRVGGERHAGTWNDVGTPERLAALNGT